MKYTSTPGPVGLIKSVSRTALLVALLVSASISQSRTITLEGTADIGGEELDFHMTLSADRQYLNRIEGYLSLQTGYDGTSFWRTENGVGPFEVDFAEREVWTVLHWLLSGYWLNPDAPIEWSTDPASGQKLFKLDDGRLYFAASEQPGNTQARFPAAIRAINAPQEIAIELTGSQQLSTLLLPETIRIKGIGQVNAFTITAATIEQSNALARYRKPQLQLAETRYLQDIDPEIEVKQATTGHLFVKPTINGEQVGWFLFDSGIGDSMLSQELIDRFDLKRVGKAHTGGIGGSTGYRPVYQGGLLQLGPLQISGLNYISYDASRGKASRILGEPVVGVLGWDILLRSIVEVDMQAGRIRIFDADKERIPQAAAQRLYLHWKVPYVDASFAGGHQGRFMFDTGAGKKGVFFPNYTVKTLDLLSLEQGEAGVVRGAGGEVPIVKATLDWFKVGGHTSRQVPATLSTGEDYEADIYSYGFLGGAVVKPFRVMLDYRRNEIGFIKRENNQGQAGSPD